MVAIVVHHPNAVPTERVQSRWVPAVRRVSFFEFPPPSPARLCFCVSHGDQCLPTPLVRTRVLYKASWRTTVRHCGLAVPGVDYTAHMRTCVVPFNIKA